MKKVLISIILTSILFGGIYNQIAISVNNEIVTTHDIKSVIAKSSLDEQKAIDYLINDRLKTYEIKKRGISISEDELRVEIENVAKRNNTNIDGFKTLLQSKNIDFNQWKNSYKEQLLTQRLYADVLRSIMEAPSQEELMLEFEKNKSEYPSKVGLSVLKFTSVSKLLLEDVIKNPMSLPQGVNKQTLELKSNDETPEIVDELKKLEEFDYSQIFSSPSGFYMYKIVEKTAPSVIAFEDVKEQILTKLIHEKEQSLLKEFFEKLKLNATIKYFKEH